jgi:hypothetical protein
MRYSSCTQRSTLGPVATRRSLALLVLAAALAAIPPSAGAAPAKHKLQAFGSCSRFVHYARRHALNELSTRGTPVSPPIFVRTPQQQSTTTSPMAAQPESAPAAGDGAGQDFSTTNVQENGVDEPDIVKTDGKRIFVAMNSHLYSLEAQDSGPPKLLDSIALEGYNNELLLDGDRLLVLNGTQINYAIDVVAAPPPRQQGAPTPAKAAIAPLPPYTQGSSLTLVDVKDPSAMKISRTMSVNGGYVTARLTGHSARVVFSATPEALPVLMQTAEAGVRRQQISRTTTPNWRPTYILRHGRKGKAARHALVRCTSIERPETFSGLNSLTVLTIDLEKGLDPVDSDAVMTDAETVYGSTKNLYIATQKAMVEQPGTEQPPAAGTTQIHKFDISDPDQTTYQATGVVSGTLLNQYSMSEQDGFLRVATTEAPLWWSPGNNKPSESFVTVLKQDGTVLTQTGRVGDLGKGERIYAVRFLGDVAYVVTFRQVDPLYTVGLSDPQHPEVLSAYLHPVGDGLLLGVGQAANEQGRTEGTQVSLFDVSDPKKPTRLSNKTVGSGSGSSVEYDPHAFLWWDPAKLAVLPVQTYSYDEQSGKSDTFAGAIGFHARKADGVTEAGRISHPQDQYGSVAPIERSLVIGNRIFTVSSAGVEASNLGSLADEGFAAFPVVQQPAPSGGGTGTAEPGQTVSSPPSK